MTLITFIEPAGQARPIDVADGWSLMQAAITGGIDGIVGECGGSCACATCHCYVDEQLMAVLAPPAANELDMLANAAAERRPNSRLACQLKVNPAFEGARLTLPETQE
jgi:2Fe-2S ferredoxin